MEKLKAKTNPGPFVLASILTSYPDSDFQSSLKELLDDESISLPRELNEKLRELSLSESAVDDLRSDYISIFDQSKSLNPLYETEYGRERAMFKATELSDIAGFYRAFGFEMDLEGGRDMVDHISVELEFYSLLMMKLLYLEESDELSGCEIVLDGMRKFMESHLGRFVTAIIERDGVQSSHVYRGIFKWVEEVVTLECDRIEVSPEVAKWFSAQGEAEEVCCGGTVEINK
ncbi:MAG TPA: molecular chaperone TorD family protein [Bdellovibrionales bacterium]|nr:molecular chaperone TorD family protein [Bdellovibrionales bacterium]